MIYVSEVYGREVGQRIEVHTPDKGYDEGLRNDRPSEEHSRCYWNLCKIPLPDHKCADGHDPENEWDQDLSAFPVVQIATIVKSDKPVES